MKHWKLVCFVIIIMVCFTACGSSEEPQTPEAMTNVIETSPEKDNEPSELSETKEETQTDLSIEMDDSIKNVKESKDGKIESYFDNSSAIDLIGYFEDNGASAEERDGVGISAWYGKWNIQVMLGAVYVRYDYDDGNHGAYTITRNVDVFGEGDTTELQISGTEYTVKRHIVDVLPIILECVKNGNPDSDPFEGIIDETSHFEGNTRVDPTTEYCWNFL